MSRLPFFWGGGFQLHDSNIDFSSNYVATGLIDPTNPSDVANKSYVDRMIADNTGSTVEIIELMGSGTANSAKVGILPPRGISTLLVTSIVDDGPVARFSVFASTTTRGDISQEGQSGGQGSVSGYVRLHLFKGTDGYYYLYKDCDAPGDESTFDGEYKVVAQIGDIQ